VLVINTMITMQLKFILLYQSCK